jgi:tRNA pseudouridine32 synthase/23S rRNA pseudouridine746 synthase
VKAPDKVFDPKAATEEEILARVLHRDGLMLVIDKPAGLSVHRGPKGRSEPGGLVRHAALRPAAPPELAHRLDRETSGCLVLGRHRKALAHLSLLFKHRRVGKTYWAVVEGGPEADEGRSTCRSGGSIRISAGG